MYIDKQSSLVDSNCHNYQGRFVGDTRDDVGSVVLEIIATF